MILPLVFCVLFLQCVFGSPLPETEEEFGWAPRYTRDFELFDSDHWYKWWYGNKRKSSAQERIQTLELRQKVLFDLVLCESHNRIRTFITDECELFRNKAEQVFGVPSKDDPSTLVPGDTKVKPPSTIGTTLAPQSTVSTIVTQDTSTNAISTTNEASTVVPTITIPTVSSTTSVSSSTVP